MKTFATTLVLVAALPMSVAYAQHNMDDMKGMSMKVADTPKTPEVDAETTYSATGTVKAVNRQANKVTLAHGPVESLRWPAMTMAYQVKDQALFDKLTVGKIVNFDFTKAKTGYLVTAVH